MYCATWHNNETLKDFCKNTGDGTEFKAFSLGICKLSWALYGAVATACEFNECCAVIQASMYREVVWLTFLAEFAFCFLFLFFHDLQHFPPLDFHASVAVE